MFRLGVQLMLMPMLVRSFRSAAILFVLFAMTGCNEIPRPRVPGGDAASGNPLGPSYVLIPLPSDDDALLGRILPELPEGGRSLEEIAQPNPCAEYLSDAKTTPLASSFDYAQELEMGAHAKVALSTFGFSGDAERATHFVYQLKTEKRVARVDTNEYVTCCKENDCGYGFISTLIYGEGEYKTGEESRVTADVNVAVVASVGGSASLKILNKRKVKGWIAALVRVTDKKQKGQVGALGVAQAAGIDEEKIAEHVRGLKQALDSF